MRKQRPARIPHNHRAIEDRMAESVVQDLERDAAIIDLTDKSLPLPPWAPNLDAQYAHGDFTQYEEHPEKFPPGFKPVLEQILPPIAGVDYDRV